MYVYSFDKKIREKSTPILDKKTMVAYYYLPKNFGNFNQNINGRTILARTIGKFQKSGKVVQNFQAKYPKGKFARHLQFFTTILKL